MPATDSPPLAWVVIGPANSGKTVVGRALAAAWDCDYLEGDHRHSAANKAKMRAGQGLTDADRGPWLDALREDLERAVRFGRRAVVSCSALKRAYRDRLAVEGRVWFLHLQLSAEELLARALVRSHEYIDPKKMGEAGLKRWLQGQLDAFEPPGADEPALTLDGALSPDELVAAALAFMAERWPKEAGHAS